MMPHVSFHCYTDFSYQNSVIITKLTIIAVTLWFLPPINSLIRPKQHSWRAVITLIDDNKYVSVDYCYKSLAVSVYMFQGAVARGDSRINKM